jgi:hypothetical protein
VARRSVERLMRLRGLHGGRTGKSVRNQQADAKAACRRFHLHLDRAGLRPRRPRHRRLCALHVLGVSSSMRTDFVLNA